MQSPVLTDLDLIVSLRPGETSVIEVDGRAYEIRPLESVPTVLRCVHPVASWARHGWAMRVPIDAYVGVESPLDVERAYRRAAPEAWTPPCFPGITAPDWLSATRAYVSVGQGLHVQAISHEGDLEVVVLYIARDGCKYRAVYNADGWRADSGGRFQARLLTVLSLAVGGVYPHVEREIIEFGDTTASDDPEFARYWSVRDRGAGHMLVGPDSVPEGEGQSG